MVHASSPKHGTYTAITIPQISPQKRPSLQTFPLTDMENFHPQLAACAAASYTQQPYPPPSAPIVYQDVHTWLSQAQSSDDTSIQQGAAHLARFLAHGQVADVQHLMVGHEIVGPLLKHLDNKKRTSLTKQACMELLGQLALFNDTYRTDIVAKSGVAVLVRQLKGDDVNSQSSALLALHRLVVLSKQRSVPFGTPVEDEEDPPPPAATPSPPPPTKGALKRLPSLPTNITSLKEKSKLTRNITRMVSGLSLTDLHQQICDAGAMETIVSMVRGDVHSQQLAADVLLDVAAHQCRVHHLAKRGAVQAAVTLIAVPTDHQAQHKGLCLLLLLLAPRPAVVAEEGLRVGNVTTLFAADGVKYVGGLLQERTPALAAKAAEVLGMLCYDDKARGRIARHGGLLDRLLTMTGEDTLVKLAAMGALHELTMDESGTVQQLLHEAGALDTLLRLIHVDQSTQALTLAMHTLCMLADTDPHRKAMLITPLIRKITTITLALDTPSIHTAAATLLRIFAPYTHPDNPNQPALAAPDTLTLLTTLLGPSNPGPCRAAAAAAVAEVAAQGDDHRVALVGLGALELLAQGVAGGGDMVVKGACAGALGQLAHMEQYKVSIAAIEYIMRDLIAMLHIHEAPRAQAQAAEALHQLVMHDANRWQLAQYGGLTELVKLLTSDAAATPAVLTLFQMAENKTYHPAIADAGAIPPLLSLAVAGDARRAPAAVAVLLALCANDTTRNTVIGVKGLSEALIKVLQSTNQHPMVCEDALAALELLAAASVPYRIVLYEAGAVEATGKLLLTSKGYEAGAVEATGKLVTGAKGTSEGGHTSEGWRTPHIAAWLLCRLAQLSHDAQAAVINTGVVPVLRNMLLRSTDQAHAVAAAACLGALAADNPHTTTLVMGQGVVPRLVHLVATAPHAHAAVAIKALTNMAAHSVDVQWEAINSNAITTLLAHVRPTAVTTVATQCAAARCLSGLMVDDDARQRALQADALSLLIALLVKTSSECKTSAANTLATLLCDQQTAQKQFCMSHGVREVLPMIQGHDIAVVMAACRLLQVLATHDALYAAIDTTTASHTLIQLVQHPNVGVSSASAAALATMMGCAGLIRETVTQQVPVLVDLVCDTKGPGRSGALHLLRVLCSLDEAMRVHLCKSKPLHKAVLKGADQYEKGSIDFENCAKLYIMLTETAGEQ